MKNAADQKVTMSFTRSASEPTTNKLVSFDYALKVTVKEAKDLECGEHIKVIIRAAEIVIRYKSGAKKGRQIIFTPADNQKAWRDFQRFTKAHVRICKAGFIVV